MTRDQRRLAAIVSADVAGYSRLMGRDDSATLAALKAHRRELIDPKIAEYGGRIVKTTGDGLLLEFPSVVEAVRCAVDVQRGMAERNAGVVLDQRIEFRVGVNVGDIIIDGDDIYGDGVNVAARLQALAEPGEICVSKAVRDQVLDKLSFGFEELGAQQVKNIVRPVEVYRVRDSPADAAVGRLQSARSSKRTALGSGLASRWRWPLGIGAALLVAGTTSWYFIHPQAPATTGGAPLMSLAVMPFVPASASPEDERFAEQLTQDVTSATERAMRWALVVSHGRVIQYKAKPFDPQIVGHDLNVRYLVEGDVRDESGAVVVAARLVETRNGSEIWSAHLAPSASAAGGRSELVAQLTNRLRPILFDAEEKRVARLSTADASAMELSLRANALWDQDPSTKGAVAARKLFEDAVRKDPQSVEALIGLSGTLEAEADDPSVDSAHRQQLVKQLNDVSLRVVQADREDPRAWITRTHALMWLLQWDSALEANAEVLRIDPSRNTALGDRALILIYTGRSEEALPVLDRAIGLNPRSDAVPWLLQLECATHLRLGHYDEAIAICEKSVALEDNWARRLLLVAAYAQKGEMAKAAVQKTELLKQQPGMSIARYKARQNVDRDSVFWKQTEAHVLPGLRKAGVPEE